MAQFFMNAPGLTKSKVMYQNLKGQKTEFTRVPTLASAQESVPFFFETVWNARASGVGLVARELADARMIINGRTTSFDLFWFPSNPNKVYAVDCNDQNYVCIMEMGTNHMLFLSERNRNHAAAKDSFCVLNLVKQ